MTSDHQRIEAGRFYEFLIDSGDAELDAEVPAMTVYLDELALVAIGMADAMGRRQNSAVKDEKTIRHIATGATALLSGDAETLLRSALAVSIRESKAWSRTNPEAGEPEAFDMAAMFTGALILITRSAEQLEIMRTEARV